MRFGDLSGDYASCGRGGTIEAAFLDVERDEDCTLRWLNWSMSREISDAEWQTAKNQNQEN